MQRYDYVVIFLGTYQLKHLYFYEKCIILKTGHPQNAAK